MEYTEISLGNGQKLLIKQLSNGNLDVLLQDKFSIMALAVKPITSNRIQIVLMEREDNYIEKGRLTT